MTGEDRKSWTEVIGDAWTLPADYRIDLGFSKQFLEKMSTYDVRLQLKEFQLFNDDLLATKTPRDFVSPPRRNWFRHFTIEDTSSRPPHGSQMYEIGRKHARTPPKTPWHNVAEQLTLLYAPQNDLPVDQKTGIPALNAPWQRLM